MKLLIIFLTLGLLSVAVSAQADRCPAIVQTALAAAERGCAETGRNQVCYGNAMLQAEPQPGDSRLVFRRPGDVVDVAQVRSLRLSPMDIAESVWGVALMRVQANLPDTLPGQNVTMLMFGDVEFRTPEDTSLQAFYFRTGIGDAPCAEAPNSGILIQTPAGSGQIAFTINEVNVQLASTAFVQAVPGEEMRLNLVDGRAIVEAFGVEQTALGHMRIRVPLDENLAASGPPGPPERCDDADMQGIPVAYWDCHSVTLVVSEFCPATIPYGMDITVHFGSGYPTEAEARAAKNVEFSSMTIDGESVPVTRTGPYYVEQYRHYAYGTNHVWGTPAPGVHRIHVVEQNGSRDCDVTILEPPE